MDGLKPAWQRINELFERFGLPHPPTRLRDELVMFNANTEPLATARAAEYPAQPIYDFTGAYMADPKCFMELDHEGQVLLMKDIAENVGWHVSKNPPPDALDREAVARIIDPAAWQKLDRERRNPTKTHANKEPWNWLRYYEMGCEPSLAKADAILALAPARGWRPIETAPRRIGEYVDLWVVLRLIVNGEIHNEKAARYADARWVDWSSGVGRWIDSGGNDIEFRAQETVEADDTDPEGIIVNERIVTHWKPLPPAPETKP